MKAQPRQCRERGKVHFAKRHQKRDGQFSRGVSSEFVTRKEVRYRHMASAVITVMPAAGCQPVTTQQIDAILAMNMARSLFIVT